MSVPEKPKLLALIERVEDVLRSIVAGPDHFYSVGVNVVRGLRVWTEATGYPFDMVYLGSDHRPAEYLPDHSVLLYPTIVVAAYVDKEGDEPVTKLVKHLRDVRAAIEADLRSNAPGSLGAMVTWAHLGAAQTDEGELGMDGLAGFRLDVQCCIQGDFDSF